MGQVDVNESHKEISYWYSFYKNVIGTCVKNTFGFLHSDDRTKELETRIEQLEQTIKQLQDLVLLMQEYSAGLHTSMPTSTISRVGYGKEVECHG